MPSTTLRRTAATLGVLAGLLAAAAPAGAQTGIGTMGVIASGGNGSDRVVGIMHELNDVKAPADSGTQDRLITYNGHAGLGGNGLRPLAYTPPVGSDKGSFTASGGWDPTHALNSGQVTAG